LDRAVEPVERTGAHLGGEDHEPDAGEDRGAELREPARGQGAQPRPDPPQHPAAAGHRRHGAGRVSPAICTPRGPRPQAWISSRPARVPLVISRWTIRPGSASGSSLVTTDRGRKHTAPPAPTSAGSSTVRPPPRSTIV